MVVKIRSATLVVINIIVVALIVYYGSFLLSKVQSFYDYVGDKIPLLGRFFEWAENLLY